MLQGYYRRLLESDPARNHLISFGAPSGRYGLLEIVNGYRWRVRQLPD